MKKRKDFLLQLLAQFGMLLLALLLGYALAAIVAKIVYPGGLEQALQLDYEIRHMIFEAMGLL